jgi:hypothetical protein
LCFISSGNPCKNVNIPTLLLITNVNAPHSPLGPQSPGIHDWCALQFVMQILMNVNI